MAIAGFFISIIFYILPSDLIGPFRENWFILTLGTLGSLCLSARATVLLACSKQNKSAFVNLLSTILRLIWILILVNKDINSPNNYIYAYAIPPIIVFLLFEIIDSNRFSLMSINFKSFSNSSRFTRNMFLWAIFTAIYWRQDLFLLNLMSYGSLVAFADIIFKFSISAMIIPNAVSAYYKPKFIGIGLPSQLNLTKKLMPILFLLSGLVVAGSGVGGYLLTIYLGNSYKEIFWPILITSFGNVIFLLTIPLNEILFSNENGGIFAIQAITVSILCGIVTILTLPFFGVFTIALSYVTAALIPFGLSYYRVNRIVKYSDYENKYIFY